MFNRGIKKTHHITFKRNIIQLQIIPATIPRVIVAVVAFPEILLNSARCPIGNSSATTNEINHAAVTVSRQFMIRQKFMIRPALGDGNESPKFLTMFR